jgi:nickel/cobalt transporter (NiCoT) family protein
MNGMLLFRSYQAYKTTCDETTLEEYFADLQSDSTNASGSDGLIMKRFRRVFSFVDAEWKMIIVGFLFALGFDTSTEIGLLVLSTTSLSSNNSSNQWLVLFLPLLFACGMSLLDYTNGCIMCRAYEWGIIKESSFNESNGQAEWDRVRTRLSKRLSFNLTVTIVSFLINVLMFVFALLSLIQGAFGLEGNAWDVLDIIGDWFWAIGLGMLILFISLWFIVVIVRK